jgi:Iap family predicted aminopeptidase
MATVRRLALEVGPREATSPAFRRAADWVATQLDGLGYDVAKQPLRVPSGISWGVPVPAGTTWNVVARPRALQPGAPYLLVGAHLDTVPQAPGAEDNASGVAVLLETARLAAALPTRLPVVFVAFAAEEPRNNDGTAHHFGSRALVSRMSAAERRSVAAMVALDRVGVGHAVPICHGAEGASALTRSLRSAARKVDVPTRSCGANRSSDHWSFERAGMPGVRIGSTPYAGYHSARDLPRVVSQPQLGRVGRVLWAWLRA